MELTPAQQKKRDKFIAFLANKDESFFDNLFEIAEKLEKLGSTIENVPVMLENLQESLKKKLESELVLEINKEELKGKDGDDYVLTDADKREIGQIAADIAIALIKPVEKVVEIRTEVNTVEKQPVVTEITKEIKIENPVSGKEIVDKINELPIEDEFQIDPEHVKGLKKFMEKRPIEPFIVSGPSSGGGRTLKSYDLSDQLDGATKTFPLPANYRIISVHASASPHILRPTVDYTYTSSSITFTSEISEASVLKNGQTLTIVYSEA